MTNKMQIVIINNQTFLTADSRRCLIDSESEGLEPSLKQRHKTFWIDADQRRDNSGGKQINKKCNKAKQKTKTSGELLFCLICHVQISFFLTSTSSSLALTGSNLGKRG